jgi:group I intron endonuclease
MEGASKLPSLHSLNMFIYEILNTKNNKKYIGQTSRSNIEIRWNEHKINLRRNKHANSKLQNAWNKYGEDAFNFCIVTQCTSLEELNKLEEQYVLNNTFGYNLQGGGKNKTMSLESRRKLSRTKRGKPNGQKGTKRGPMSEQQKIQLIKRTRPAGYSDVVDPMGNVHHVRSVKEFSRQHNLVFSGVATLFSTRPCFHYKGWRIATPETIGVPFDLSGYSKALSISKGRRTKKFPTLKNPQGTIYKIEGTLTEFCKTYQLNIGNVSDLINNKKSIYKGWTVANDILEK